MGRRPDLPTRRALALRLPLIPVFASVLGAGGLANAAAAQEPAATPPPRGKRLLATVILLRHAERSADGNPNDPSLSEAGQKRAQSLARLLSRAGTTHLFASEFHRSQETLAPLAEAAKLKVEIVPAAKAAELVERIFGLELGSVVVIAGHANTIPAMTAAFGGEIKGLEETPQGRMLSEKDFDRLFVVAPHAEAAPKAPVLELAYGN